MIGLINRAIAGVAAILVLAVGLPASAQDNIRVGVAAEPYPPFSSQDASGKWVGWEVDLMDAICKEMQANCELVATAWDGIIPALTSKKIDIIFTSMSITDERKQVIDFSDKYYNTPAVIIGPKDQKYGIKKSDLSGKIIGVQISTIHQNYVQKYFSEVVKELKSYQTQDEANADLAAGRLDAVMADSIALQAFLKSEAGQCCDVKGTLPNDVAIFGIGIGAGVRKEDQELKQRINVAIKAVRDSGAYQEISDKYKADFGDIDIFGQ